MNNQENIAGQTNCAFCQFEKGHSFECPKYKEENDEEGFEEERKKGWYEEGYNKGYSEGINKKIDYDKEGWDEILEEEYEKGYAQRKKEEPEFYIEEFGKKAKQDFAEKIIEKIKGLKLNGELNVGDKYNQAISNIIALIKKEI